MLKSRGKRTKDKTEKTHFELRFIKLKREGVASNPTYYNRLKLIYHRRNIETYSISRNYLLIIKKGTRIRNLHEIKQKHQIII